MAQLERAYLIVGSDELMKQKALDKLCSYADESMKDFNVDIINAADKPEPELLISSLNMLPMMDDYRLVIIKQLENLDKASQEALIDYLKNPNPQSVCLGIATKLAKNTRLYKAFAASHPKALISCEAKKAWELASQAQKIAQEQQLYLDHDAAELLVSLLGESSLLYQTELKRLALQFGKGYKLSYEDIYTNVKRIAEIKPWTFLDALFDRRLSYALELFEQMPDQNIMGLYVMSLSRLRELISYKSLAKEGREHYAAQELGMQPWQLKNHAKWSKNFSSEGLIRSLKMAADCEHELKSVSDKRGAYLNWILSLYAE